MRHSIIFTILSTFFWFSGCSTLTVKYDYNQKIDFATFTTYDWIPFPEDMPASIIDQSRFITSVEIALTSKGITHSSSNPDFLIATHFGKKAQINLNNWGYSYAANTYYAGNNDSPFGRYGFGSEYTPSGGGLSTTEYEQGTLIVDFVDAKSHKLAWRATAKAIINPADAPGEQSKRILNAVNEILSMFPPQKANTD